MNIRHARRLCSGFRGAEQRTTMTSEPYLSIAAFPREIRRLRLLPAIFAFSLLPLSLLGGATARADGQQCLGTLEKQLAGKFDTITHVIPEQLEALQNDTGALLLLDVREESEHKVASLPGAERVDPSIRVDEFLSRFGDRVAGRQVVLFCSVGYRSSVAAARLRKALEARGARGVVNLRGGIFAWHNTGRTTVDHHGATVYLHPYSRRWQSYIDFSNLARMSPRKSATE
jgi:rhodanese-related sulfurtransferase